MRRRSQKTPLQHPPVVQRETTTPTPINSLRLRQNGRYLADDTFKRILLNENVRIWIKNSLKFVPKGPINNIPALVQIMAWCRPGDKPLSEPMMVSSPTHICVTRPQWVTVHTSPYESLSGTLTVGRHQIPSYVNQWFNMYHVISFLLMKRTLNVTQAPRSLA